MFVVKGVFDDIPVNSTLQADCFISSKWLLEQINQKFKDRNAATDWEPDYWGTWLLLDKNADAASLDEQFRALEKKVYGEKDRYDFSVQKLSDVYLNSQGIQSSAAQGNMKNIRIFSAIAILIIIVAAFNMVSSLIMIVMNKRKEIGILKAIGFSPTDIQQIFVAFGSIIGLVGSLNGLLLGLLIAKNIDSIFDGLEFLVNTVLQFFQSIVNLFNPEFFIANFQIFSNEVYYFDRVPVKINFSEIFIIVSVSMFLIFLSSYIPAKKASQVKPKEVIHNE